MAKENIKLEILRIWVFDKMLSVQWNFLAMDRLSPQLVYTCCILSGVDRFHPLNTKLSQQLEDVERRLSNLTLDQGMTQREEDTASISDASHSPNVDVSNGDVGVMPQALQMFSTPHREASATRITRQV